MDTHAFKRSLHHSERYNRRGFGRAEEVAESLEQAYPVSYTHLTLPTTSPV